MRPNGTPNYARLHKRGLTFLQQNAVDLLASGKNDTEAAELLNVARVTITKWRLYDPVFQAALNRRRTEVWAAGADRLRALIPEALNVLAEELKNPENRVKAATAILKMATIPTGKPEGPTDPDTIVRDLAENRRKEAPNPLEEMRSERNGRPTLQKTMDEIWAELDETLSEPALPKT